MKTGCEAIFNPKIKRGKKPKTFESFILIIIDQFITIRESLTTSGNTQKSYSESVRLNLIT